MESPRDEGILKGISVEKDCNDNSVFIGRIMRFGEPVHVVCKELFILRLWFRRILTSACCADDFH